MASSSIPLLKTAFTIVLLTLLIFFTTTTRASISSPKSYKSIISFGDSLADTGNLLLLVNLTSPEIPSNYFLPPYGESYFQHPTGRFSDGRLVIDFIAESFGLPFIPPYLAGKFDTTSERDFVQGVNFAVAGATALDASFLQEKGIHNGMTNVSLGTQLRWFKDMFGSICKISSNCSEFLGSSLVLMGEIGGNDYNYALLVGRKIDEATSLVTLVVRTIGSAIMEMIELGAMNLMVPGNFPIGCLPAYLTYFQSSNKLDYDMATGCLNWLNKFSEYHNELLQIQLERIRKLHPHANIIYADNYNAALRLYRNPHNYGFEKRALSACCGAGGPYNYNSAHGCGSPASTTCDDPSLYISWDGIHFTEAAYKLIAQGLLEGPYSTPPFNAICAVASTTTPFLLQI